MNGNNSLAAKTLQEIRDFVSSDVSKDKFIKTGLSYKLVDDIDLVRIYEVGSKNGCFGVIFADFNYVFAETKYRIY